MEDNGGDEENGMWFCVHCGGSKGVLVLVENIVRKWIKVHEVEAVRLRMRQE